MISYLVSKWTKARKIGQAKRSISCRGGLTVQAIAASGPAAPEPGQSRPADRASFSLPCLTRKGRVKKKDMGKIAIILSRKEIAVMFSFLLKTLMVFSYLMFAPVL